MIRLGAYGQITTGSVLGIFGDETRQFSDELLRKGLVHVLASDAHNTRGRPPVLSKALAAMIPLVGEARAVAMTGAAPRALLAGEAPELPAVDDATPRGRAWLGRWFRRR